ncbi:hypothetical protein ACFYPG_17605 [Micromonospora sp. NPDC005553]|uniref:hypothetical protein n=1 Tax=Micromonospora sp. NPDC005553 TaxID=3364232 RepID=UPI00368FDB5A
MSIDKGNPLPGENMGEDRHATHHDQRAAGGQQYGTVRLTQVGGQSDGPVPTPTGLIVDGRVGR